MPGSSSTTRIFSAGSAFKVAISEVACMPIRLAVRCGARMSRLQHSRNAEAAEGRSCLSPSPQKVVIAANQRPARRFVGAGPVQLLDGGVHLVEQGALAIVADQALDPEERRQPL